MAVYSDIAVNKDGYLISRNGDLLKVYDSDEIRQHVIQRLKTFRAEWFLNIFVGVPYFEYVFKKNYNLSTISSILKRVILTTEGVTKLESFELSLDPRSRVLSVFVEIKGMLEPVTLEVSI